MKKRLLVMCPNPDDATSWWRGAGPFSHLDRRISDEWEQILYKSPTIAWSDFSYIDVLFLQRPFKNAHRDLIITARDMGVKVWVDYDDDLTKVPYSNPAYKTFGGKEVPENVKWIAENADAVTVSTHKLFSLFEPLNKRTKIVPNAWNSLAYPPRRPHAADGKVILWRGSKTHDEDLDFYIEPMARVSEMYPDWKWIFIGEPHWKVTKVIKNHIVIPGMNAPQYNQFLADLQEHRPAVAVVPLTFSDFNESKSNIAWIEASFAGAACVVPDMEEWSSVPAFRYRDTDQFFNALTGLIESPAENRKFMAESAWQTVKVKYNLDSVNQIRQDLLEELFHERRR